MIAFVAVESGRWEKDGVSLPVLTWKAVRDGEPIGQAESWMDLQMVDAENAILTFGFTGSTAIRFGPDELAQLGFRVGMQDKTRKGD